MLDDSICMHLLACEFVVDVLLIKGRKDIHN